MVKTRKRRRRRRKNIYTRKQYNSGEGMLTSVWGPGLWFFLHTISFNYPHKPTAEQKKNTIKTLFCNLNIFCLAVIVGRI